MTGEAVAAFLTQGAVPLLCRPGHHFVADDAESAYFSLHGFLRKAGKSLAKQWLNATRLDSYLVGDGWPHGKVLKPIYHA